MKSIIISNEPKPAEIKYPCLMQSRDTGKILLFESEQSGTVLERGKNIDNIQVVGYHSSTWVKATDTTTWTPFVGVIELSN